MEEDFAIQGFSALSQGTRLRLMRLLATHEPTGLPAGQIAIQLGQAPSTLSFHLSALEQAGLIQSTRSGRQITYRIHFAGLRRLFMFLTETCCGSQPELCAELSRLLPDLPENTTTLHSAYNVLFVCTRNSARSIMAEAILSKIGKGRFNAYSAGSHPAQSPMPEVLERLAAMGHDVSTLSSKSWERFTGPDAPKMDFVITLCDPEMGEACPDLGARPLSAVWPFPDPAKFNGSDVERAALLNELYGMIRRRLDAFINLPFAALDRMSLQAKLDEMGDTGAFNA